MSGRRRRRYRLRGEISVRAPKAPPLVRPRGGNQGVTVLTPSFAQHKSGLHGRRFLIVTAPFGGFGPALARVLEKRGAEVGRMIFNAGDALNWPRRGGIVFRETPNVWAREIHQRLAGFTDVIIFGEGGSYNRAVLSAAETLSARVWVLENGYFRPDWITVERNGVNASSALPRFRDAYPDPAPELPPVRHVGRILPYHVVNISLYHTVQGLGGFLFPNQDVHYTVSPLRQCLGHIRRYVGLAFHKPENCDADLIASRGPFFIACLQREGDAQLLRYSRYADNTAFLAAVLTSFAQGAAAGDRLVVKNHPLDPGLIDLRAVTLRLAKERGLAGRVDFIDGGNLAQLCRNSRGMVVNNSSAALSALGFHTPVKVLGDAFFDFAGLTDQQPLDGFWATPQAPDAELFTRFRAHVISQSQVNGNYHEPRSIEPTALGVADMFERVSEK